MSKTDLDALAERYRELSVQLIASTETEDLVKRAKVLLRMVELLKEMGKDSN